MFKGAPLAAWSRRHPVIVRKATRTAGIILALLFVLVAGLVVIPAASPSTGAQIADLLRSVIGVQAVAEMESVSFQIQDVINSTRYQITGQKPALSFSSAVSTVVATLPPIKTRTPLHPAATAPAQVATATAEPRQPTALPPPPTATPVPLPDIVEASPHVDGGWQAFGPVVGGHSVMARGSVKPDPARPYAQAAVVRIDLSKVNLHFVLGTQEPVAAPGTRPIARTGAIPTLDQAPDSLLIAFNGGFKSIHGHYGVQLNGTNVITPQYGLASLVIYDNGAINLGAWGIEITDTQHIVAIRQNCPMLVDSGTINPSVTDGNRKEWGYTVKNLDTTWRSGIGVTKDGRFLIYATGNSLTVESLGRALLMAGAYNGMQLDINGFYTRFAIYQPANGKGKYPVVAQKLLDQMTVLPTQFLQPYDRDFFYVTLLPG